MEKFGCHSAFRWTIKNVWQIAFREKKNTGLLAGGKTSNSLHEYEAKEIKCKLSFYFMVNLMWLLFLTGNWEHCALYNMLLLFMKTRRKCGLPHYHHHHHSATNAVHKFCFMLFKRKTKDQTGI